MMKFRKNNSIALKKKSTSIPSVSLLADIKKIAALVETGRSQAQISTSKVSFTYLL